VTTEAVAIVLAGGSGKRLREATPKAFLSLAGRPMLAHAARAALSCGEVSSVVVAAPSGLEDLARSMLEDMGPHAVVTGGPSRQASVRAALEVVPEEVPAIVCHDAARPFARPQLFSRVLAALADSDGVIPVLPVPDTVKRIREGFVVATEPRDELGLAQTPQAFAAQPLRDAHRRAAEAGLDLTDDAAIVEWAGYRIRVVPGDPTNFKITTQDDLVRAELHAEELADG
jgi:2-C-methyl-D-erythritol 4-phosphate cytidylyltransferase/2-C-methyl-D-erythritol 2,4-cyclodiphosphate synthase